MKLSKELLWAVLLIVIIVTVYYYFRAEEKVSVCFDGICVEVEVVETVEDRAKGLMFSESLAENSGMLFIFKEEGNYPFWMKNTLIPLDIIWVNSEKMIVEIVTAIPCDEDPCGNYGGNRSAMYVVEVNAGFVKKNGIEVGEFIEINR